MTKNSELRRIDKNLARAIDEQKKKIKELTGIDVSDKQASESLFKKLERIKLKVKF